jgi:hypothetical protein
MDVIDNLFGWMLSIICEQKSTYKRDRFRTNPKTSIIMTKVTNRTHVKDLLLKFQQFCLLNENKGFCLRDFETFFKLEHDKQRILKLAETGANHGKFLLYWKKSLDTPFSKSAYCSKIYLDPLWAQRNHLPPPPDDSCTDCAYMHCGSKRVFIKKLKNNVEDANILCPLLCGEQDILDYWEDYIEKHGERDINVDHLRTDFAQFVRDLEMSENPRRKRGRKRAQSDDSILVTRPPLTKRRKTSFSQSE